MKNEIVERFDASSTADEVVAAVDLFGKLVVITGDAAGIGRETARALARRGADLVIGGRNLQAIEAASGELALLGPGTIRAQEVDLLSLESVSRFAASIRALARPVDGLILNAGVMACPLARSPEGIESQMATNFVGHALLTSRLVPALLDSRAPRVVALSSTAHQMSPIMFDDINYARRPYDPWEAYAQSKTANVLLAVKVWNQLGRHGVTAHAVHPGGVITGLLKHMSGDIAAQLADRYKFDTSGIQVKTPEQGAATSVWALTESTLGGRATEYLEDCHVAEHLTQPLYRRGVMEYALDADNAAALWSSAEKMTGMQFPLEP